MTKAPLDWTNPWPTSTAYQDSDFIMIGGRCYHLMGWEIHTTLTIHEPKPMVPKNWKWYDIFRVAPRLVEEFCSSQLVKRDHQVQEKYPRLEKARNKRKQYVQKLRRT